MYIGEPFKISEIYNKINKTKGVIDTLKVTAKVLNTDGYSSAGNVHMDDILSPDGSYINTPKNCILEIKYPNKDIRGFVV